MTIAASRIGPLPAGLKPTPGITFVVVDIDFNAAGLAATYRYLCSTAPGKPVFTDFMGIVE